MRAYSASVKKGLAHEKGPGYEASRATDKLPNHHFTQLTVTLYSGLKALRTG